MGLETVKEEIIGSAKSQADALIKEARAEAAKIRKEAEKKTQELEEKSSAEAKKSIETMKKQDLASAELESKKMLLEAKKQLVEDVFSEVEKKLKGLNSKDREGYMKKLLKKAKDDIEVASVYCNKKDVKMVEGFDAEPVEILGGLIAENADKTVRVDYSFETMLQSIKENELQSINKLLFG